MAVDYKAQTGETCRGDAVAKIVTSADNNKLSWSMHHE